ncbi:MAG: hypothetical protein RDV48_06020 [Candidatus Eremiobacteraeota bacterium]|nr:hypothetical protein [Candidatus Eremiobacteraeota bacterium]
MSLKRKERGLSIAMTLIILTILVVIVFAIAARGIYGLRASTLEKRDRILFYAAEAGMQEALLNYKRNSSDWSSGIPLKEIWRNGSEIARCQVSVTNNQQALQGAASLTAPDGTIVPPGLCYFLSTGSFANYPITKKVGVMVKYSFLGTFNYALAAGDKISFNASSKIYGNIKSNNTINFEAACEVISVKGQGNVFCSKDINVNAKLEMETSQFCRARADITGASKILNATVVAYDTSADTLPFSCEAATTMADSTGIESMPNPDISKLLASATLVEHTETTWDKELNLDSKVHYFPNGVTFGNKSSYKGTGSIVTGNGTNMVFERSLGDSKSYYPVNLVALGNWDALTKKYSGGNISFTGGSHCFVNGLVFAHGSITTNSTFAVQGTVIAYSGMVSTSSQADFIFYPIPVFCPGFEAWSIGPGTERVDIISWQRK